MRRSTFSPEADCAIAQSLGVIGDGWELLIVRDLARGVSRFDELAGSLRISRKVLTERLNSLVDSRIVNKAAYQDRPTRYAYELTPRGRALLPVLVALQDWGDRWLLGDGSLTGTNAADEPPAQRLLELVGQRVPYVALPSTRGTTADAPSAHDTTSDTVAPSTRGTTTDAPSTRGTTADAPATSGTTADTDGLSARGTTVDVVDVGARTTVIFGYPATGRPSPLPDGWGEIPGAAGCTLENRLFGARYDEFAAKGIAVRGVSTQRTDEQQAFAQGEEIPHLLLSDLDLELTAALRLPTFRAGGYERLKRFVLIVGADRVVRSVRYPVTDIADAVDWALTTG
ncbi:winged helix-turn-helix transcriptional regulator [Kribbella sp. NPDC003505]|uniref:winged helix-turn-helix transcriptional regulator n=1 Tax=Kribbella sp. NPDC003505 TaxID=3154448 RepID=UPI0033B007D6